MECEQTMSDADTIREALHNIGNEGANLTDFPDALAALERLVAERDEARHNRDDADLSAQLSRDATAIWRARAEDAKTRVARLEAALQAIIEEFRRGIRAGEPQRYDERDPVVIIARAALASGSEGENG